jgi:dipeptidyl aminopeptidase/acylaminoacyl peptidase
MRLIFHIFLAFLATDFAMADNQTINRASIMHPDNSSKETEFFWSAPSGEGPFPAVILVHGHQPTLRAGARYCIYLGLHEYFVEEGFYTVTVSQAGYGRSDGPSDFIGPFTQHGLASVVAHLREAPMVDRSKIGIFGYSRGAGLAALVAATSDVKAVAVGGGIYDLVNAYPILPQGIKDSIASEAGNSSEALRERSPIHKLAGTSADYLLFHGELDQNAPSQYATLFFDEIKARGLNAEIKILPGQGHEIPMSLWLGDVTSFFRRKLN